MKKIKKLQLLLIVVLCLSLSMLFVACNKDVVISFDTQGGSTIEEIVVDDDFAMPANPTKTGFIFAGWFLDKDCTDSQEFDSSKINDYKESFTVYAKWVDENITLASPTLSVSGNTVSWTEVEADGLDVVYYVQVDDGLALAYSETQVALDMYADGQHSVNVYAALKANSDKKSQTVSTNVAVVASEDSATDITPAYSSATAIENGETVLILYSGLETTIDNAKSLSTTSPLVTINGNKITPKNSVGFFTLNIVRTDDTTASYKVYVRPQIALFSVTNKNEDDRGEYRKSDDSYLVGIANEFHFNVAMQAHTGDEITDVYVPLIYEIKDGNTTLVEGTDYAVSKNNIRFDAELKGKTLAVSVRPKYIPTKNDTQVPAKTMSITLTDGVNVYDNEGLKSAVNDTSIAEISIHNEIIPAFNDKQKFAGKDYAKHIAALQFTKQNYDKNANVYARFVDNTDVVKKLTINGNYFDINGENLPLLKRETGYNDNEAGIASGQNGSLFIRNPNESTPSATQYEIYSQEAGFFAFMSTVDDFEVEINNLHIRGNCDLSNETDDALLSQQFIKDESGALHGIVASQVKLTTNNVRINNVMQGYQMRHYGAGSNTFSTTIGTELVMDSGIVENTFYSSVYAVSAKINVKNSYFRNAGCAIFAVVDYWQDPAVSEGIGGGTEDAKYNVYPYDPEITLDSTNVYENWSAGNEAYYSTEENMSGLALQLKMLVSQNLKDQGTGHSITKSIDGTDKFNFILQFIDQVDHKKMHVIFTENGQTKAELNRTSLYSIRETVSGTVSGGDLRAVNNNFMSPVGAYSDLTAFLTAANGGQLGANPFAGTFTTNVATFGEGQNTGRKMLEVVAAQSITSDITAIVEMGQVVDGGDWFYQSYPQE